MLYLGKETSLALLTTSTLSCHGRGIAHFLCEDDDHRVREIVMEICWLRAVLLVFMSILVLECRESEGKVVGAAVMPHGMLFKKLYISPLYPLFFIIMNLAYNLRCLEPYGEGVYGELIKYWGGGVEVAFIGYIKIQNMGHPQSLSYM